MSMTIISFLSDAFNVMGCENVSYLYSITLMGLYLQKHKLESPGIQPAGSACEQPSWLCWQSPENKKEQIKAK